MAKNKDKQRNPKKAALIVLLILAGFLVICLTVVIYPYAKRLSGAEGEELRVQLAFYRDALNKIGFWRYPAVVLFQILQMVLAIIPGGPLAILMGFMFGTFGATLLASLGNLLGTALIVWGVNKFGEKFVKLFVNSKGFEKLKFLHDPMKRDSLLFLLFLIPGTPKDLITFFAPFTQAKPSSIVVMATVGRLPALILSAAIGANLSEGEMAQTVLLFALTALLGLLGILIRDKVMKKD